MFFDLTVFLHEVVIDAMAHHSEISTPSAGGMQLLIRLEFAARTDFP